MDHAPEAVAPLPPQRIFVIDRGFDAWGDHTPDLLGHLAEYAQHVREEEAA